MECTEYRETSAAHVDGVLAPAERFDAEAHVSSCPNCKKIFVWERETKRLMQKKLKVIPAPGALKAKVLEPPKATEQKSTWHSFFTGHGLAVAFAFLLIGLAPYLMWQHTPGSNSSDDLFTHAITHYQRVRAGAFDTGWGVFPGAPARLLDLSPWGYRLLSRQTDRVQAKVGRAFVYMGQSDQYLVAQEFDGGSLLPTSGTTPVRISDKDFVTYSREGVNLIAWQEKDLVCILTSTLPREELIRLARQVALRS